MHGNDQEGCQEDKDEQNHDDQPLPASDSVAFALFRLAMTEPEFII